MTRITNFGRKRTYLEAGFGLHDGATTGEQDTDGGDAPETREDSVDVRKSSKKSKKVKVAQDEAEAGGREPVDDNEENKGNKMTRKKEKSHKNEGTRARQGSKTKADRLKSTEERRIRRQDTKLADAICFACREKGHTARECPSAVQVDEGKSMVGICYRCGSNRHSLSRCKKKPNSSNPLPFASCFVCSGKGHLASTCPKNVSKGVYPNGGCCKLCGETSHLAKDCGLRKAEITSSTPIFLDSPAHGPASRRDNAAGADEDDFHTFKRRKIEVDEDEKRERKVARRLEKQQKRHEAPSRSIAPVATISSLETEALSGGQAPRLIRPLGSSTTKKAKVVTF